MWEDAFGRKDVANRALMINGVAVRIVGVAPPQFNGVFRDGDDPRLMLWLPLSTRTTVLAAGIAAEPSAPAALSSVDSTLFQAVGRLAPGVSPEKATAAVRVVAANAVAARRARSSSSSVAYASSTAPTSAHGSSSQGYAGPSHSLWPLPTSLFVASIGIPSWTSPVQPSENAGQHDCFAPAAGGEIHREYDVDDTSGAARSVMLSPMTAATTVELSRE
jgi:hypothetical protein